MRGSGDGEEEQPGATFPPYPPSSVYKGMGYGHLAPLVRGLRYVNASGALVDLDARRSPLEASAVRALGGSFGLMGPVVSVLLETRPLALVETRLKVVPQEAQESDEAFTEKLLALRNECDNMLVRETLLIFLYGDQRSSGKGGGDNVPFFFYHSLCLCLFFFSLLYEHFHFCLLFFLFFLFFSKGRFAHFFSLLRLRLLPLPLLEGSRDVVSLPFYDQKTNQNTKALISLGGVASSGSTVEIDPTFKRPWAYVELRTRRRGADAQKVPLYNKLAIDWSGALVSFFSFSRGRGVFRRRRRKKEEERSHFFSSLSLLPPTLPYFSLSLSLSLTGGGQS